MVLQAIVLWHMLPVKRVADASFIRSEGYRAKGATREKHFKSLLERGRALHYGANYRSLHF